MHYLNKCIHYMTDYLKKTNRSQNYAIVKLTNVLAFLHINYLYILTPSFNLQLTN